MVRRRGVGGVLVPLLPWRGLGVGGRQEGAASPPVGHRPPQPSVGVWWLEGHPALTFVQNDKHSVMLLERELRPEDF